MPKRAAEEPPPSLDCSSTGPNFLSYYRDQVAELLSQEERIPYHELGVTKKSSTEIIGVEISSLKAEKLKDIATKVEKYLLDKLDVYESAVGDATTKMTQQIVWNLRYMIV